MEGRGGVLHSPSEQIGRKIQAKPSVHLTAGALHLCEFEDKLYRPTIAYFTPIIFETMDFLSPYRPAILWLSRMKIYGST